MISRKGADIITIIFVILIIFSIFFLPGLIPRPSLDTLISEGGTTPEKMMEYQAGVAQSMMIMQLILSVPILIYWIIMLITAIQLHGKGNQYYSIGNIVIQALIVPFTFIFYLVSLRRGMNKYELDKKTGTPPKGTRIISSPRH